MALSDADGPRCMYICVVETFLWPVNSRINASGAPRIDKCEQNEWRSMWTPFLMAAFFTAISLCEGIDLGTPAGRLQLHLLAAIAEFERARIQERVRAGLARARAQGKRLGRPLSVVPVDRLATVSALSNTDAARGLGVSLSTMKRWRRGQKTITAAA